MAKCGKFGNFLWQNVANLAIFLWQNVANLAIFYGKMWQIWQFFMAKFANFCGKIWQNLGFQMAIFCDASQISLMTSAFSTNIFNFYLYISPLYIGLNPSPPRKLQRRNI